MILVLKRLPAGIDLPTPRRIVLGVRYEGSRRIAVADGVRGQVAGGRPTLHPHRRGRAAALGWLAHVQAAGERLFPSRRNRPPQGSQSNAFN